MFREKKYIIYGKNRYQRDFEYIFDNIEIVYYIDETERINDVFHYTKVLEENIEDICIIICVSENEQKVAEDNLKKLGLVHKIHFYLMDDFFSSLDMNLSEKTKNKKVVLWGTGVVAERFVTNYSAYYPELKFDVVVDNDLEKEGKTFANLKITPMNKLNQEENYFIIIAISEYRYKELISELEKNSLKAEYVYATQLLMEKPSILLKRTIYDKNQFEIKVCSKINDMRVLSDGFVTPCGSVNGIKIGNLFCNTLSEVWGSVHEKIYRLSILNRTHTFCDIRKCPYLVNREVAESTFEYHDQKRVKPRMLLLETDSSCNIMCFSCRDQIIKVENEFFDAYTERIKEAYIKGCERLVLSGNGEVFASKYAKDILLSKESLEKEEISILSNGFAFNKDNWKRYLEHYSKVNVSISIDAATKATYEKIRRKSSWEVLNKNLEFIKELKKEGKISFFQINFVVQKLNVHEMKLFVELGKHYNVDRVLFNMLEDWNLPERRFYENSVMDEKNRIKEEYRSYFKEVADEEIVDFTNIAQAIGKYAKDAYMY